jgi:RNA polymerase sigma-32 factor
MKDIKPKKPKAKSSAKKTTHKQVVAEVVEDSDDLQPVVEDHHSEEPQLDDEGLAALEPSRRLPAKVGERGVAKSDPVALYLAELRKYPLLSREQEQELAKKYYETKDPLAAQALVTANLRFVVKIAAEYSKFGAKMIDLIQEGNMGLMHAVRDFNPHKGVKLITYAVWWIRGYIQEYLMKQYSMVKIGTTQNQKKLFYQLQRQKEALDSLGERPDVAMIAAKMGIPQDEVEMMAQRMSGRDISLDRPMDSDSPTTLGDMQSSSGEDMVEELSRHQNLERLKEKIEELRPELNERETILLEERLLNDEPLTLQEIGEKYGITREAVRQAEVRLMKKIKDKFEA